MEVEKIFTFGYHKLLEVSQDQRQMAAYGYDSEEIKGILRTMNAWKYKERFPGAQPVSLDMKIVQGQLQQRQTLVCEKTDGMRYLLLEAINGTGKTWWILVNRKYDMYMVKAAPDQGEIIHQGDRASNSRLEIRNLFDGELVNDKEWRSKNVYTGEKPKPIFLVFDAILVNRSNEMASPFRVRLVQADKYLKKRFTAARMGLIS